MKILFLFLCVLATTMVNAQQDVRADRVIADKQLWLRGYRADTLSNDTANARGKIHTMLTADAISKLVGSGGGSGTKVGIDMTYDSLGFHRNDSVLFKSLRIKLNGVVATPTITESTLEYDIPDSSITNVITGGDTTVFSPVIDSTGQPGFRILYGVSGNHISSSRYLLYDSVAKKLVIGNSNIAVAGTNQLYVQGDALIGGTSAAGHLKGGTLQVTGMSVITDTTANKPMGIKTDGVVGKFATWGGLIKPFVNFNSLTTTGTSGIATLSSGVLNIPNYGASNPMDSHGDMITGAASPAGGLQKLDYPGEMYTLITSGAEPRWTYWMSRFGMSKLETGANSGISTGTPVFIKNGASNTLVSIPTHISEDKDFRYFKNIGSGNLYVTASGSQFWTDHAQDSLTLLPGQSAMTIAGNNYWLVFFNPDNASAQNFQTVTDNGAFTTNSFGTNGTANSSITVIVSGAASTAQMQAHNSTNQVGVTINAGDPFGQYFFNAELPYVQFKTMHSGFGNLVGTLYADSLDANNRWRLPKATGTIALTSDISALGAVVSTDDNFLEVTASVVRTRKTFQALTFASSATMNLATGFNWYQTITGDELVTPSNIQSGNQITFIVTQDGTGGHELTFDTQIIPTKQDPDSITVIGCIYDGTVWHCTSDASGGVGGTSTIAGATDANISSPADADIFMYKTSDGKWHNVAVSGDFTISNSGVGSIGAAKVVNSMINSVAWSKITSTPTTLAGYNISDAQPLDPDLTAIAAEVATTDNFLVSVSSAWKSRTPAQVKTTLSLNNVENTALSTWAGSTNVTTLGTIGTGTWQGGIIAGLYGGTGVANSGKTITLGGNLTTSGAFNTTFTVTGSNTITFPNASITVARSDAAQTFTGVQTFSSNPVIASFTNTGTHTLPTVTGTIMEYAESGTTSTAAPTPTGDARVNWYQLTALNANTTFGVPTGTPANHNELYIRIVDANSVARNLNWNAIYRASSELPLPTITTLGKEMYLHFFYNSRTTTWDLVGNLNNFGFGEEAIIISILFSGLATYIEEKRKRRNIA